SLTEMDSTEEDSSYSVDKGAIDSSSNDLLADSSQFTEQDSSNLVDMGATSEESAVALTAQDATYGTFENYSTAEFGTLTVDTLVNTGTITVDEQATVSSGGTAENGGIITGDGEFVIAGASEDEDGNAIDGAILTNSGDITTSTITLEDGASLVNNGETSEVATMNANAGSTFTINDGSFTVNSLVSDGEVTYNQYGGTFKINEGFFTESELNIYGGTLDASENSTGSLGDNVINISSAVGNTIGEINDEDDPDTKYSALDGLSKVLANTLTSETTVNIYEGGLLSVETLDFDGTENTVNLEGGALLTHASQLFEYVQSEAISLDATDPENGSVILQTEAITETEVGAMKEEVIAALNIAEQSNLLIADSYFNTEFVVAVEESLSEGLGDDFNNLTVNFMGTMTQKMTVDVVHNLEDEGLEAVSNPGVVFNTTTLWNETEETGTENSGLIVGSSEATDGYNAFETSMGFMNIAEADTVTIVNGAELALVGQAGEMDGESYALDENKLLVDSEDGGSIVVEDGTFTMGTYGALDPSVGWVNSVDLLSSDSTLQTKNGEFAAWTITNEGLVDVGVSSILHTNTITGSGSYNIDGSLYVVDGDDVDAALEIAEGATLTIGSTGYMNVRDIESLEVNGSIINNKEANYSDMLITSTGKDTNLGNERGEYLTVEGIHANSGTSIWLGLDVKSGGDVENKGDMTVGDEFTVEEGGEVNNGEDGVIDASTVDEAEIDGTVNNDGIIHWHDVHIGPTGEHNNAGTEDGNHLDNQGHYHNTGSATWNDGVVVEDGGVLDNDGDMDIDNQFDIEEGGEVNNGNDGVIDATDMDEANIDGTVNNDGTIYWPNVNIGPNGEDNNSGFEQGHHLDNQGHHNNTGTSNWDNGVEIEDGGVLDNDGDMDIDNQFDIDEGGEVNNGEDGFIDAQDMDEAHDNGTVNNDGTI
ncbi:MAG: hypothetical protein LUF79_06995, partial [Enterococcus sp.]|nr:hypothetical protein [Enterococcus sp.]